VIALHRLTVKDFIGIDEVDINFEELRKKAGQRGVVLIIGPNGAGKSSLVEAVYFAITGLVPRFSNSKKSAVRAGRPFAHVSLEFTAPDGKRYVVERFIERGNTKKKHDRLWEVDTKNLVVKGSKEVDNVIKRLFGFADTDKATSEFRKVLRKVFTVFQGEMDELIGTTADARPEEILRRVGLLDINKEGINRVLRHEKRDITKELNDATEREEDILTRMKEKAQRLYMFAGFDSPPDSPVEVAKRLNEKLIEQTVERMRSVIQARQAREELKRLSVELTDIKKKLTGVKSRLNALRSEVNTLQSSFPFFSAPEFEEFMDAVSYMQEKVLNISAAIVDVAEGLQRWGGYAGAYEDYVTSVEDIKGIVGATRLKAMDVLTQAYRWALDRLEENYGQVSGSHREFARSLLDELKVKLNRLRVLKRELADFDRKITTLQKQIFQKKKELDVSKDRLMQVEGEIAKGIDLLQEKEDYRKYYEHYRAKGKYSKLQQTVEKLKERLVRLQSSALLQIFSPMKEEEAWEVLRRFTEVPVRSDASRKMLPDVMRAAASIVASGSVESVDIGKVVSLREKLHGLESEMMALKMSMLPEDPEVSPQDVVGKLRQIREFEVRRKELEGKRQRLTAEVDRLSRELSMLEGREKQLVAERERRQEEMEKILHDFGDEGQISEMLGYAEFVYTTADFMRSKKDVDVSLDFGHVNFIELSREARRYFAAIHEISSHLGDLLRTRLGGRLPEPLYFDEAVDFAVRYGGIIKLLRDRWKPSEWGTEVRVRYMEFKDKSRRLDELEGQLHGLIAEKAAIESEIKGLKEIEQQGAAFENDELVGHLIGSVKAVESVDRLAGELLSDAESMRVLLEELGVVQEKKMQLRRRHAVLERLITVLDAFYSWYIGRRTAMFITKLSTILHSISGRYRVAKSQNGVLEVSDELSGSQRAINSLSGGERVMVGLAFIFALAQMLVNTGRDRGGVFFVDEGFSSLDADRKNRLGEIVEMFAGDGRLIFIITHDERVKDSFPPDTVTLAVKHGNVTVKILEEISGSKLTETVSLYADDTEDF